MIFKSIYTIKNFFSNSELQLAIDEANLHNFNIEGLAYMGKASESKVSKELQDLIVKKFTEKFDVFTSLHPEFGIQLRLTTSEDYCKNKVSGIHTDCLEDYDKNMLACIIPLSECTNTPMGLKFFSSELLNKKQLYQPLDVKDLSDLKKFKWKEFADVPYKINEAVVFHPSIFHSPYPLHGYGDNIGNARLSLHCFIRVGYNERLHENNFNIQVKEL
jgi:hypothetical protein